MLVRRTWWSRLLGPSRLEPLAVMFPVALWLAVGSFFEDRVGLGWAALLLSLAMLIVFLRNWAASVRLDDDAITVCGVFGCRCIAWRDIDAVVLTSIVWLHGAPVPAPVLRLQDGQRVELAHFVGFSKRLRNEEAERLLSFARDRSVETCIDANSTDHWRGVDVSVCYPLLADRDRALKRK